jgi:alginate O-acetyltransferase complex protein AlgI
MIIEKLLEKYLAKTPRIIRHAYTLILIVFSRAIFYFTDFEKLKLFIANLFSSNNPIGVGFATDIFEHLFWFILVILFCIPWDEIYSNEDKIALNAQRFYTNAKPILNVVMLFLATLLLVNSTYNPFLYTRF